MASAISSLTAADTTTTSTSSSSSSSSLSDSLGEDAFLQLLVTQLKNQNPMDPMDSTGFVTQLAQFSQLEQTIQIQEDVATLTDALTSSSS